MLDFLLIVYLPGHAELLESLDDLTHPSASICRNISSNSYRQGIPTTLFVHYDGQKIDTIIPLTEWAIERHIIFFLTPNRSYILQSPDVRCIWILG